MKMKKKTKIQKKLEKLLQLHDHEKIELGLSRIRKLTSKLSNPQDKLKIISLVGSNGKGSVGSFLFSIAHLYNSIILRFYQKIYKKM